MLGQFSKNCGHSPAMVILLTTTITIRHKDPRCRSPFVEDKLPSCPLDLYATAVSSSRPCQHLCGGGGAAGGPHLLCHILSTVHIFLNHTNLFDIKLVYNENPFLKKSMLLSATYKLEKAISRT